MPCRSKACLFDELPEAALASILELVPQRDRLSSCALVCRAWADAARKATTEVRTDILAANKAAPLQAWLQQYGQHITSVQISDLRQMCGLKVHVLQLPCLSLPALKLLVLAKVKVDLTETVPVSCVSTRSMRRGMLAAPAAAVHASQSIAAGSHRRGGSGGMQASGSSSGHNGKEGFLPMLQQLRLVGCKLPERQLLQLTHMTGLTSLCMHRVDLTRGTKSSHALGCRQGCKSLQRVLHQLPDLQHLTITRLSEDTGGVADRRLPCALDAVSGMQRLQSLTVDRYVCVRLDQVMSALPASLTHLDLDRSHLKTPTAAALQAASHLSSLQRLRLNRIELDPRILGYWCKLTHLDMDGIDLGGYITGQGQPINAMPSDIRRLLAAVEQLTQLQHLQLRGIGALTVQTFLTYQPSQHSQLPATLLH